MHVRDIKKDNETDLFGRSGLWAWSPKLAETQKEIILKFRVRRRFCEPSGLTLNTVITPASSGVSLRKQDVSGGSLPSGEDPGLRLPGLGRCRHQSQPLRASTVGWYSGVLLYLISFPQNGRNHAALEVPAGVVVLLSVVRWDRRPELGPQMLIGAGYGAHGHSIQDETLLQPQRTLAAVCHPKHSSLGEPLGCERSPRWGLLCALLRSCSYVVRTHATQTLLSLFNGVGF